MVYLLNNLMIRYFLQKWQCYFQFFQFYMYSLKIEILIHFVKKYYFKDLFIFISILIKKN